MQGRNAPAFSREGGVRLRRAGAGSAGGTPVPDGASPGQAVAGRARVPSGDSEDYEACRVRESTWRIVRLAPKVIALNVLIQVLQVLCGQLTPQSFVCTSLPFNVIATIVLETNAVQACILRRTNSHGIAVQALINVAQVGYFLHVSLQMSSELMQHRVFLTAGVPLLCLFSAVGYVPKRLFLGFICPLHGLAWVAFHYLVSFVSIPIMCCGFMHCTCFGYCIYGVIDHCERSKFEAVHTLKQERKFLEARDVCLQCMLSSVFDASCTCNGRGEIRSCTQQLQQLLAGEMSLLERDICAFAASAVEAARLRQFLQHAAQSAKRQTVTIQTSLRCASRVSGVPHLFEAKLFAIASPCRAKPDEGLQHDNDIFIGFQMQAADNCAEEEAKEGDAAEPLLRHGEPSAAGTCEQPEGAPGASAARPAPDAMKADAAGTDAAAGTGLSLAQLVDSGKKSAAEGHVDAEAASSVLSLSHSPEQSMCSHPWSTAPSSMTKHSWVLQSGPQSAPSEQHPVASLRSVAVQTRHSRPPAVPGAGRSSPHIPPPPPDDWSPTEDSPRSRRNHRQSSLHTPFRRRVILHSSRCVLPHFQETRMDSVLQLIYPTLLQLNARGVGCCTWHITLYSLVRAIQLLETRPCMEAFRPLSGWQCERCVCMNEREDSDSGEGGTPLECTVCGHDGVLMPTGGDTLGSHA